MHGLLLVLRSVIWGQALVGLKLGGHEQVAGSAAVACRPRRRGGVRPRQPRDDTAHGSLSSVKMLSVKVFQALKSSYCGKELNQLRSSSTSG